MPKSDAPNRSPGRGLDCVGRRLAVASRIARTTLEEQLARSGATFAGYLVLATLARQGAVIQRHLADELSIEGPTLTRQLERLERENLITRTAATHDRRATVVRLTQHGKATVEQLDESVLKADAQILESLRPADVTRLIAILDTLIANRPTRQG